MKKWIVSVVPLLLVAGCGDDMTAMTPPDDPPEPPITPPGPSREEMVADILESVRDQPIALEQFLFEMPKGADLHSHISGAIPPETLIDWGAQDGNCVNTTTFYASAGPCVEPAVPIANALEDEALYTSLLTAWSMEGFEGTLLEQHQHFFDAFGKYDAVIASDERGDDMLAEVLKIAARNNQHYLELMTGFGSGTVGRIAANYIPVGAPWNEAYLLEKRLQIIADPAFATALDGAKTRLANMQTGAQELLGCSTATAEPGCDVDVRWIVSASRTRGREYVFAQWIFAYELAQAVPEVVGVNLVQPEEAELSLRDYDDMMYSLGVLHRMNQRDASRKPVRIALHAGELIPEVLPMTAEGQSHLTFHIRRAVEVAQAERIGHGVDVLGETDGDGAEDLLNDLRERSVMIEICLSSNDVLLGAVGDTHPLNAYLENNVPVALATDDQGILRLEITDEYVRAVKEHDLDYQTIKKMVRTSLEHSFAPGGSLWKTRDVYEEKVEDCASDTPGADALSTGCAAFLEANGRARLQWKLEERFASFEEAMLVVMQ